MKLQQKTISLSTNKIPELTQIHQSGFNSQSNFTTKSNMFIYACGKNVILDYYNSDNDNSKQVQLVAHDANVSCTCVSNSFVIASGQLASPGSKNYDSHVYLWVVGKMEPVGRLLGLKEGVKGLVFSEDSRFLAGVSYKNQLIIWDTKTQTQLYTKSSQSPILPLHFSSSTLTLLLHQSLQSLTLTPLLTHNKPPTTSSFTLPSTGLPRVYTCLAVIGNEVVVVGTESGELCVFGKGVFKGGVAVGKGVVRGIGVRAGEVFVGVGGEVVRMEVVGDGLKEKDRKTLPQPIRYLSIDQYGQIFCMSATTIFHLTPTLTPTPLRISHTSKITHVTTKNNLIATIDEQGTIACRSYKNGEVSVMSLWKYPLPKIGGRCVEVGQLGVLGGFGDGKVVGLGAQGGKFQWEVSAHKGAVTSIFTNQSYMLTGGQDCVVRIWSKSRQLINQISAHQKPISKVLGDILSPNLIHSCSLDRSIQTYDLKTDKKLNFRQALGGNVSDMIQDYGNGDLVTCGIGSNVSFWKSNDHQCYKSLKSQMGNILKLALNSSSSILALGHDTGLISLFNTKTNTPIGTNRAHSSIITGISWIGENVFVTVSEDYSIAVWRYQ